MWWKLLTFARVPTNVEAIVNEAEDIKAQVSCKHLPKILCEAVYKAILDLSDVMSIIHLGK